MYQIAIIPNNTEANIALWFKTEEAQQKAWAAIKVMNDVSDTIECSDDYGTSVCIKVSYVSYMICIDIGKSQDIQFDKDMAINAAREKIEKRLRGMGFSSQKVQPKSQIIQ